MAPTRSEDTVESCELCIIGAGIAGLNALFVARQYLKRNDRVILIDRRDGPGGMWTDVYDYSRLHQPHPTFTVGDMKWHWSKPGHYLATGAEVRAHLERCYKRLQGKVDIVERFGHTVTRCHEVSGDRGPFVRVECHANGEAGAARIIEAKRVIKAVGYDVQAAEPMSFTSGAVVSTTPERLGRDTGFDGKAAVFVVGGGKTGMDTAHTLIRHAPGRPVTMINGRGAVFADRGIFFPSADRRWREGELVANAFRDLSLQFDGTNEDEAFDFFRRTYSIGLEGSRELFFFGILSQEERDTIAEGLCGIVNDYLADVVDGPDGPEMVFRSGARRLVEPGSVFVNCTGHLVRNHHAYEPYLSEHGSILTITTRSMVHFLTSASAYFLSHLFFLDRLHGLPLYEYDGETVLARNGRVYHTALISLSYMNLAIAIRALPLRVVTRCGLDFDRLYPLPRRVRALIDLKLNGRRYIDHCRQALDRVRLIHGVRCGPLVHRDGRRTEESRANGTDHPVEDPPTETSGYRKAA